MATKCTMLIRTGSSLQGGSSQVINRVGGFSESWYNPAVFSPALETNFIGLAQRRAALLPSLASIVGFRYQATDGLTSGATVTRTTAIPGTAAVQPDVPQMALKFDIDANGTPNQRIWLMRAVPDSQITNGEYQPSATFRTNVSTFFAALSASWQFRGQNLAVPTTAIFNITAAGVITWLAAPGYVDGAIIRILRARGADGRAQGGRFLVNNVVGNTGQLLGWPFGLCTGGKSRLYQIIFPSIPIGTDAPNTAQAVVKKVGRPFFLYRGRRAARR